MWCDLVAMMMAFYLRHGQSHAAAELSMRGSRGSRGFRCLCINSEDGQGRKGLASVTRRERCAHSVLWSAPDFEGTAWTCWGHTQVDFRTKLQGVGKLHVYKEAERKEIGTGVNRSRNRKWSDQGYNSMETL